MAGDSEAAVKTTTAADNSGVSKLWNNIKGLAQDTAEATGLDTAADYVADKAEAAVKYGALKLDPSGSVSKFLNNLAEEKPELEDVLNIIAADDELTAAIANLELTKEGTLEKIMGNFTGSENSTPEEQAAAIEAGVAILSNDVLRGQLTEVINNIADNPDFTDENVTELLDASKNYKSTVEGMGLGKVFGTAVLGVENDELTAATQRLTQAYVDLGMDEADAKAAISEGWKIGIEQKIGGMDDFGSHISGFVNTLMFDLKPLLEMLGLDKLLSQIGIEFEGGLASIFGEDFANKFQATVKPYTDWAEGNLNLNIADKYIAPHISGNMPEFIEKNITKNVGVFQADEPATTGKVIDFPNKFSQATSGVTVMTPEQVQETMVKIDPKLADEMQGISSDADLKAQFDKFGSMTKDDLGREVAELQSKLANPDVTVREAVAGIGTPGM